VYDNITLKVFFMLAVVRDKQIQADIREESNTYNDIVQQGFLEDYHSMTYKAIGALKWLHMRCNNTKYFLKTDDDTFVNIFTILKHLQALTDHDMGKYGILMCCLGHLKPVLRTGKWAVTRSEFPEGYYPHYCSGMAYILTPDVVSAIYLASAHVPYFWIDDIFITGMVTEVIGLKLIEMKPAYILEIDKREELFRGEEWYKFAFCHVPITSQFTTLWEIVLAKGTSQVIPDVTELEPGKLADNYTYQGRTRLSRYYVPPLA
jgi:beta-1,3-galactosyltransferase 1